MIKKKRKSARYLLLSLIIVSIFSAALFYFLIFTTQGAGLIARKIVPRIIGAGKIEFKEINGSLFKKIIFEDLRLEGLKWLPPNSALTIRRLELSLFFIKGMQAEIRNGKILIPDSRPIFIRGYLQTGALNLNVYSKGAGLKNIIGLFPGSHLFNKVSGTADILDIYIKGSLSEPVFSGTFRIDKLIHEGFSILNCPGSFILKLTRANNEIKLKGEVVINQGLIYGPNAVTIKLDNSKILFSGNPLKPKFDLKGNSRVGNVKIDITLNGTLDSPELILVSEPPLSQEKLLVMLTTGKSWTGTETALNKGIISPDLAVDFIDFFVLGGSGSKIAQQFGISDISVKFDKQTKGIGLKKDVFDKVSIGYGIEQSQTEEKQTSINQKLSGEYKITEAVSVGAEKELKQEDKSDETQNNHETNDKIMLKFKKKF
jgi:hypothetical protein